MRKVPRHGLDFRVTASLKSQCRVWQVIVYWSMEFLLFWQVGHLDVGCHGCITSWTWLVPQWCSEITRRNKSFRFTNCYDYPPVVFLWWKMCTVFNISGSITSRRGGSTCDISICGGSTCDISICGGSTCDISICGGSTCDISICGGSTCDISICGGSTCDISICGGCMRYFDLWRLNMRYFDLWRLYMRYFDLCFSVSCSGYDVMMHGWAPVSALNMVVSVMRTFSDGFPAGLVDLTTLWFFYFILFFVLIIFHTWTKNRQEKKEGGRRLQDKYNSVHGWEGERSWE